MSEASTSPESHAGFEDEPEAETLSGFSVVGRSVRTSNDAESEPTQGRLPGLWHHFLAQGGLEGVPGRHPDSPVFGIYSEYEGEGRGEYTVTAAVKTARKQELPEGYVRREVPAGLYLVFTGYGTLPTVVIATWARIWSWFAEDRPWRRTFTTDFEMYDEVGVVDIYVAVEPA